MTLVSSANNIDSDAGFIPRGRSFICIRNNRFPRIDPWGIHVSFYPNQKKKRTILGDLTSTSCLLLVK